MPVFGREIEVVPGSDRDELVGIVDEQGQVVNAALRSRVRQSNLRHGATATLIRNKDHQIYVHQRSPEKDWRPAHYDVASGGVILLGEEPKESALRELDEELGITGVELKELGTSLFEDETTRVLSWIYEANWDGPIEFRNQQIIWGEWISLETLQQRLADPNWLFVPDTRLLLTRLHQRKVMDY